MDALGIIAAISALILSVSIHEAAHGWAADRFGDPTARELGRITINPIKHLDPMMSVIVPGMLYVLTNGSMVFGGAKPVPFDPSRMRPGTNIKAAISWVAAAGPISNFILAMLGAITSEFLRARFGYGVTGSAVYIFVSQMFSINLILGLFNLLPIPPLDGAKVLAGFLPDRMALGLYRLERFAILFFILIIATPITRVLFGPYFFLMDKMTQVAKALVW